MCKLKSIASHPRLFPSFLIPHCRALELSLGYTNGTNGENNGALSPAFATEDDLTLALRVSMEEQNRRELELRREQEMIEEAIRLSLQEK